MNLNPRYESDSHVNVSLHISQSISLVIYFALCRLQTAPAFLVRLCHIYKLCGTRSVSTTSDFSSSMHVGKRWSCAGNPSSALTRCSNCQSITVFLLFTWWLSQQRDEIIVSMTTMQSCCVKLCYSYLTSWTEFHHFTCTWNRRHTDTAPVDMTDSNYNRKPPSSTAFSARQRWVFAGSASDLFICGLQGSKQVTCVTHIKHINCWLAV